MPESAACSRYSRAVPAASPQPTRDTIAVVVLARTGSSRLPGKPLIRVGGRPLIDYVLDRAHLIEGADEVVVATTDDAVDDDLALHCTDLGVRVFRGESENVARRVLSCAEELGAAWIVRVNGDSPFLDPDLVSGAMSETRADVDVISNVPGRTFPYGVTVEVVRTEALASALPRMTPEEREHVTLHFYRHPEDFEIRQLASPRPDLAGERLTVDSEEDLERFARVVEVLGDEVASADFVQVATTYALGAETTT